MGDESSKTPRRLIVIGLAMEAGFLLLGLPRLTVPARLLVQTALFCLYLVALRSMARDPLPRHGLRVVVVLAVLFRATLLASPPFYSDDLYRYLWDGHVQVEGRLNPYLHPPGAEVLAPLRDEVFPRVNHPDIPTIYPPVAQGLFAAVVLVSKSVPAIKGALVLVDLALIGVLLGLLRRVGLPEGQLLVYAWSPLVVAEVAGNGHIDVLGVLLLLAGIHLIILERPLLSTVALGLSIGSKFLPLLALPVLVRRLKARHRALPILVAAASYLPYAGAGPALFRGLREYAERWQHNDSLFTPLLLWLEFLRPTGALKAGIAWMNDALGYPGWVEALYRYTYPVYLARMFAFGIAAALATLLAWRKTDPIRGSFLILGAVLLLSPTVHPWYVLWIVPLLAIRPNRAWILLTGLVPLSYLDSGTVGGGINGMAWIRWVWYLPFFALLLVDAAISYRRRDPVTLFGLGQFPPGLAATTLPAADPRPE